MSRSLERLLAELPKHILHQPCTDIDSKCREMLLQISQSSLLTHFTLGRWLGIPENELQDIQHENLSSSASEKRYLVFLRWINTNGSEATHCLLLKALYGGGDVKTVELITNKLAPVSATRQAETCSYNKEQAAIITKDVKNIPSPYTGTPISTVTPITPNITFPESIQEESVSQRHTHSLISDQSVTTSEQETGVPSCPTRPITLSFNNPPSCPMKISPFKTMPKCTSRVGQILQQRMNNTIAEYKEKAHTDWSNYIQTQEKLESMTHENQMQREELSRAGGKMRRIIQEANNIHSENYQLKQELELDQHLLAILCDALRVWKEEVHEDIVVCPLQTQIESLLQSVRSSSVPESLKFIQRDFKKMKEERDCLDQELTSLFSLYAEKQTQLAAIIEENRRLEKNDQFQHREILQLKDRVHELMGKCERMSIKNMELEKKVSMLEQEKKELADKCNELESNRLIYVLSKPAQANISTHGFLRSHSEGTYVEQKLHPLLFKHCSEDSTYNINDLVEKRSTQCGNLDMNNNGNEMDSVSLDWINIVNEMVKKCDDSDTVVAKSVQDIQQQLVDFRINQKFQ